MTVVCGNSGGTMVYEYKVGRYVLVLIRYKGR